jgi:hypothetical protein
VTRSGDDHHHDHDDSEEELIASSALSFIIVLCRSCGRSQAMLILTDVEIRHRGLKVVGFSDVILARSKQDSLEDDFRAHFGSSSLAMAQLWEALQTSPLAAVAGTKKNLDDFLKALYFLKAYPCLRDQRSRFNVCINTASTCTWKWVPKIAALKADKARNLQFECMPLSLN